jgi:two-component system response regulator
MNDFADIEILLVEDNPTDAEMALRALKKSFLNKVFWVQDGVEALDFLRCTGSYESRPHQLPKLVLLDMKMPRLDGFSVLRELKSAEGTRSIPVVMMSSSSQDRDLAKAYQLGVNGYAVKPIHFEELVEALGRIGMYWLRVNLLPLGMISGLAVSNASF